jgi:tRNA pseudouridine38-40 synthase
VQGELEAALATITQHPARVIGAGRTDSGVHAIGQVVAFSATWQHTLADLHRAWNAVLPRDVVVWSLTTAKPGFHPRFDAQSRAYRYTIWNNAIRNPLLRRTALWYARPLDVDRMTEATRTLVGEHDFATFGSPPQGTNTTRQVHRAAWQRDAETLCFDIEANAFLYRMVRSIVGTLLQVGAGELSVAQFAALFEAADRAQAGPTAPARGLCLMAVDY